MAFSNEESKEQLLGRASHCPSAGSDLKWNDFNSKSLKYVLSMLLSTSAARPLINNKLIEIEKRVDLVGESQPR